MCYKCYTESKGSVYAIVYPFGHYVPSVLLRSFRYAKLRLRALPSAQDDTFGFSWSRMRACRPQTAGGLLEELHAILPRQPLQGVSANTSNSPLNPNSPPRLLCSHPSPFPKSFLGGGAGGALFAKRAPPAPPPKKLFGKGEGCEHNKRGGELGFSGEFDVFALTPCRGWRGRIACNSSNKPPAVCGRQARIRDQLKPNVSS